MSEKLDLESKKLNSHLAKGVKPIIVSVGKPALQDMQEAIGDNFEGRQIEEITWGDDEKTLDEKGILHAGKSTYVISKIDSANKFSKNFQRCTGLVVTGIDKDTGENISFVTHQDPAYFLSPKAKEKFIERLQLRLAEIKDRCVPGTIDALFLGGKYLPPPSKNDDNSWNLAEAYTDSVKLIGSEVRKTLGFEPIVFNGPQFLNGDDDVYYDNDKRRVFFVRSQVNSNLGGFRTGEMDKEEKKFKGYGALYQTGSE